MRPVPLSGLPVLLTGASSGIGKVTALLLAERGFRVIATMRDLTRATPLQSEAAQRGIKLELLQLDVTDSASVRRAVEDVAGRYQGIGALVANAGIQVRGCFEDLSDDEIRNVFETNVFGTMAVVREVVPHLRSARNGRIVLVSSVGGRIGAFAMSAYCASKFALEGFGECLAVELAPFGIGVSLVEPGMVNTEIWRANRGVAQRSLEIASPYRQWFENSEKMADWAVKTSPVREEHVARAVEAALTATRPQLRYLVGSRARVVLAAQRFLPERLFQAIYRRVQSRGAPTPGH